MAKKCMKYREMRREYPNPGAQSLQNLWSPTRLYPSVWIMSYLLPQSCFERPNPRRNQVILVAPTRRYVE